MNDSNIIKIEGRIRECSLIQYGYYICLFLSVLEELAILGFRPELSKMYMEHLSVPESKEVLKNKINDSMSKRHRSSQWPKLEQFE